MGSQRIASSKSLDSGSWAVSYFHSDHLGSSNVITDDTGNQIALYEYSPYGETVTNQTPKVNGAFQEQAGLLVIEAEHYHSNTPGANAHTWEENSTYAGYSGEGTMLASPNNGTNQNTGYVANSPRLDYSVNIANPGVYTIWVRAYAPSYVDDSLHIGLYGQTVSTSNRITKFTLGQYDWSKGTKDGPVATINISTPGEHTLNVWMREDGIYFDKLLLTLVPDFPEPTGTGPAESDQVTDTTPQVTSYLFTGKELDASTGLYFYGARYYDPEIGRFITPDTIVQSPSDPQSLNRYAYARNNPIRYIDPTGHAWFIPFIIGAIKGAIAGALIGGAIAAITGSNIGQGFLTGAISGFFFGGVGGLGLEGMWQTIGHGIAGGISGSINAEITGADIGQGALIGGVSAGVSEWLGTNVGFLKQASGKGIGAYVLNMMRRAAVGAMVGGSVAEATGGNFGYGAKQGALTAGIAYTANHWLHKITEAIKDLNVKNEVRPNKDITKTQSETPSSIIDEIRDRLYKSAITFTEKLGIDTDSRSFSSKHYWAEYGSSVLQNAVPITVGSIVMLSSSTLLSFTAATLLFSGSAGLAISAYKQAWLPIHGEESQRYPVIQNYNPK